MSTHYSLSIYRFNPDVDKQPYMKDYSIDRSAIRGIMLLDLLKAVKVQDASLSFRHSCGAGICGSDGMNINGRNGLACMTQLVDLPNHITLRPLPGIAVIRDLIVDMALFYKQFNAVKPYLQAAKPSTGLEFKQSQAERKKLDGLYECILCACCTTACPSWWWNPDKFIGPAGLLQAYRFLVDSRDTDTEQRLANLDDPFSVFRCHGIQNCVAVCPKGLNPTKAIGHIRNMLLRSAT